MNTSRVTRVSGALASLVIVCGLLACSGEDRTGEDATTAPTTAAPASDTAPLPQGTPADTVPGPGTQLDITAIRAGSHTGYDRIVLDLDGVGTPGSSLRLTTTPTADGSGFPVEYTGDLAMTVAVHGITYNGVEPSVSGFPAGVVASVKAMGAFEGTQLIVIGLTDGDITLADISVSALDTPTRLVIDIRR